MKHLFYFNTVFIVYLSITTARAQNATSCEKYFYSDKTNNKSVAFKDRPVIKTKPLILYKTGNVTLRMSMIKRENNTIEIISRHRKGFHRAIKIGLEQKIGIVFKDNSVYIMDFINNPSKEEKQLIQLSEKSSYINSLLLDNDLLEKLRIHQINSIEIQNPFGSNPNKVKKKVLKGKHAQCIQIAASCFYLQKY